MQRWSSVAVGCLALVALAILIWQGSARQSPLSGHLPPGALPAPSAPGSLLMPPALLPPSIDSALLELASPPAAGAPAKPLPPGAPRSVRFGVVLVKYRGVEMAGEIDRPRADALAIAVAVNDLAKKDFREAVKHGDPGSTLDAGRVARGILEAHVERELFLLAPGDVSRPIDTPRGFWVAKRLE